MADTKLLLGDFEFQDFEIPASIPLGGDQSLVIHKLPGGVRVVQAMGRDDAPISWTGSMYSPDALDRMRQLDMMRVQGEPVVLSMFGFNYLVMIKSFIPRVERSYRVQYSLELVVVADNTQAQQRSGGISIDTAIRSDTSTASSLGGEVGDASLTAQLTQLSAGVASVANFEQSTQALLNVVRNPASSASLRVAQLLNGSNTVVGSVSAIGGVVSGVPASTLTTAFQQQVAASGSMPALYDLQSTLGRIERNLNLLNPNTSGNTVTTAGGSLFTLAEKLYGDATRWPALAQANGLTDPVLTGVQTLNVPKNPPDNGGLPNS